MISESKSNQSFFVLLLILSNRLGRIFLLRSEDVGLSSIFNDDDDGSDTSMEMLKDEVVLRFKQLFGTNVLHHLGSNNLTGFAYFVGNISLFIISARKIKNIKETSLLV